MGERLDRHRSRGRSVVCVGSREPCAPAATWRFDLTPAGVGTRVRQHVQLGPGPSGLTARIAELPDREEDIIAARSAEHRHNMQITLQGLKAAAEQEL